MSRCIHRTGRVSSFLSFCCKRIQPIDLLAKLRPASFHAVHVLLKMNALINTMEKGTCRSGEWLMQEGEPGDAMYVIKSGKLEVFVGGRLTRHVGRGCAVGELALLYHTPRSASVKVGQQARCTRAFSWLTRYAEEDTPDSLFCSFRCGILPLTQFV